MNRREFVRVLAGMGVLFSPVWRLLKKRPSVEEGLNLASLQKGLARLRDSAKAVVPSLRKLAASCQEVKDYGKLIFWDPYFGKGDDANDGHSPETPVATLAAAIDLADAGPSGGMVITFCQSREGPRLVVKQDEAIG